VPRPLPPRGTPLQTPFSAPQGAAPLVSTLPVRAAVEAPTSPTGAVTPDNAPRRPLAPANGPHGYPEEWTRGRPLIFVDVETTGLDPYVHETVEVGWYDFATGASGQFIPRHTLANATPQALKVNRYYERYAGKAQDDGSQVKALYDTLLKARLAGANVRFDAGFLSRLFAAYGFRQEPWHFRLLDVQAFAAGVMGTMDAEILGLPDLAVMFGVPINKDVQHSALADVLTTVDVYRALLRIIAHRRGA
jgi:DNA polymerase-3 subunit epsilon